MPISFKTTLRRARYICVKIRQVMEFRAPHDLSPLKHISDEQARDIGLKPSELEQIRFEYPSCKQNHPRL